MTTHSPKVFICGIAYNILTTQDEADHADAGVLTFDISASQMTEDEHRDMIYHHNAVRIPAPVARDLDAKFKGLPMYVAHDTSGSPVGTVLSSDVRGDQIFISAEITDAATIARMKGNELNSLSIGYSANLKRTGIDRYTLNEVSVCNTPRFEGCDITVMASRDELAATRAARPTAPLGRGFSYRTSLPPPPPYHPYCNPDLTLNRSST